jgi:hypothetical protein
MPDKFQKIVEDAVYSVAVMGNVTTGAFELIDMQTQAKDAVLRQSAKDATFLGVVGIVHGHPRCAFAELLSQGMYDAITNAFCQRIEAGVIYLEQLMSTSTGEN